MAMAALSLSFFYGVALLHRSHFTLTDIKYISIVKVILGLTAIKWIQYSVFIWGIGFGIVHIGYDLYIYLQYERIFS